MSVKTIEPTTPLRTEQNGHITIDQLPLAVSRNLIDLSHIETENDDPVDNFFSAKQRRLLVEPLYTSWETERPFVADADVGLFYGVHVPPLVPDMLLSMDVTVNDDWWTKVNRSYFTFEFGKPPEIAIEIVSNKKGGEATRKKGLYATAGVTWYIIYDPQLAIQDEPLVVYQRNANGYRRMVTNAFPSLGLSIGIWDGEYENSQSRWLRWFTLGGRLIPTGLEKSIVQSQRADEAQQRADEEKQRADTAESTNALLRAKLIEMGIDPGTLK